MPASVRLLAIDLHDHGSGPRWRDPRPMTLADEAAAVLARVDAALTGTVQRLPVHLLGHSYGGAVALKLASMHPAAVRSVSVYEPVLFNLLRSCPDSGAQAGQVHALVRTMDCHLGEQRAWHAAQAFIDYWSGSGSFQTWPDTRQLATAQQMPTILAHFNALLADDALSDWLAQPTVPLNLYVGDQTVASTRRIGELLRARCPAVRHTVLAGLGHMGPLTHPQQVNPHFIRAIVGGG